MDFPTKIKKSQDKFHITRQCYNHVLSCHAAVLHIKAARDFSPQTEIQLPRTGSDCCEDFFPQNGSWIRNHHNYSYADMVDMLPKMNRLNEIRVSKDGPVIPKGHKKQMNIWDEGNPRTGNAPDLRDYPTDDAFSAAWTEGITCAQNICSEVGMVPDGEPENDAEKLSKQFAWYYLPHLTGKEAFKTICLVLLTTSYGQRSFQNNLVLLTTSYGQRSFQNNLLGTTYHILRAEKLSKQFAWYYLPHLTGREAFKTICLVLLTTSYGQRSFQNNLLGTTYHILRAEKLSKQFAWYYLPHLTGKEAFKTIWYYLPHLTGREAFKTICLVLLTTSYGQEKLSKQFAWYYLPHLTGREAFKTIWYYLPHLTGREAFKTIWYYLPHLTGREAFKTICLVLLTTSYGQRSFQNNLLGTTYHILRAEKLSKQFAWYYLPHLTGREAFKTICLVLLTTSYGQRS